MQSSFWFRILIVIPILAAFLLAQVYFFRKSWALAGRIERSSLRRMVRCAVAVAFSFVLFFLLFDAFLARRDILWRYAGLVGVVGLWVTSALWAYAAIKGVAAADWGWRLLSRIWHKAPADARAVDAPAAESEAAIVDHSRREWLQTATLIAGALPFACGGYGFFVGRREYQVREVILPVSGWPQALQDLRIVQLSDIHVGSYMAVSDVRRVVDMANDLKADLAVVTGDFLTGAGDPLEDCIRELARLRAPLGIWGCNGNHEIYADAEALAAKLFKRNGMDLLRQQSVELVRHSQRFNLIGVDYQRPQGFDSTAPAMLEGVETLVRRDMPNILLSHNPNAFPRAAELGIELTLAGHTHGGQVKVEILDRTVSPARFLTPYIAGLFRRPLGSGEKLEDAQAWSAAPTRPASLLYVNSGLGTIFAPVRLGVPPEISIFTLRRA